MGAYDTVDWRRRVFALYADVRASRRPGRAHDLWRRGRDELFASHPASPAARGGPRRSFRGLPVPAYDPAWRFEVEVRPPRPSGSRSPPAPTARSRSSGSAWWSSPMSASSTSGASRRTAAGCSSRSRTRRPAARRHLRRRALPRSTPSRARTWAAAPGALVLDLNFAYNPSCAYDPDWACPLAQPGNTVEVEVPVGERG